MRFIVVHQAYLVELLFMFADHCLYVNNNLNLFKANKSFQKIV